MDYYTIPTEELALSEQRRMREGAIQMGKDRATARWEFTAGNLRAREAHYVNDFLTPAAVAVVGLSGWLSLPFAALATWYSIFASSVPAAVAPVCPTNQIWVFYKVSVLSIAPLNQATAIRLGVGTGPNWVAQFDLEGIYGKNVLDGYFSAPVPFENPDTVTAQVQSRVITGAGCRVRLGCIIVEPAQQTVV